MVSEENLVTTCGSCHVGANKRFTGYLSHATHKDDPKLRWAYIFMTALLLAVFSFFGIHLLMWLPRSVKERRKKEERRSPKKPGTSIIKRFSRNQRITHIFVIISFILLARDRNDAEVCPYGLGTSSLPGSLAVWPGCRSASSHWCSDHLWLFCLPYL